MFFPKSTRSVPAEEDHDAPRLVNAFFKAILLIFILLAFGIAGFSGVEGWTFQEALYMSVITVSTVGYTEVQPLTGAGRLFASGYIMVSMLVTTYAMTIVARTIFHGELMRARGAIRMKKKIDGMKGHIIMCGFETELPHFMLQELLDFQESVVVVAEDPYHRHELEERGVPFILGSAHKDGILEAAGVKRAKALLALMSSEAENVFVTLSARSLNETLIIMTATELPGGEKKLHRAGANHVVSPHKVSSTRMIQTLLNPYVNDFLEIASDDSGERLIIEQLVIKKGAPLTQDTLLNLAVRQKTGVTIAGYRDAEGKVFFDLNADTVIPVGATLIALGTSTSLEKLQKQFLEV
jgi:voltage-gated potassium channel